MMSPVPPKPGNPDLARDLLAAERKRVNEARKLAEQAAAPPEAIAPTTAIEIPAASPPADVQLDPNYPG